MNQLLTIGLSHYLCVGGLLFIIGIMGICLNRTNVILMLMAVEVILLAVSLNFIAFSAFLFDLMGQVFVFFVLTVGAAETAIGLAILVAFFRNQGTVSVQDMEKLKG
ncbi:MAG: NADH-quinone oxidoreductase subunit K [Alphaproteobacteria bacterium 16-39-46]|nr:MAG: NADH-quinone oxidoreductase subunit K [Alphaproteobacteria bacterium 16-39-46]OZA43520.1 MAG: NADH-quinone oxidoreductase subunit K [Alphaproteobacteria bacterium 17-39-52]HQS83835.1 NADH-quinone oxidoreductase subunit NuoK [Alphaproteobacteria bacterium]HQS93702.1 NADH-quinone oxidoreductase subunit NuoK [Alphaproteobacteria bacterium]